MIVPMHKVTLFISARHQDTALNELRKIGVLHVQHVKAPASEDIAQLEMLLSDVEKSQLILSNVIPGEEGRKKLELSADKAVSEALSYALEKQQLLTQIDEKKVLLNWFEAWGKVSVQDVEALQKKSVFIRLYNTDKNLLKTLPEGAFMEILQEEKNQVKIALISESTDIRLDIKEEFLSTEKYGTVTKELASLAARNEDVDLYLQRLLESRDAIENYKRDLEKQLEFARVKSGMQDVEEIVYLQGYCPEEKTEKLVKATEKQGWGLLSEEPEMTDNPPTLLKMSKWTAIIKPVFEFLGTVPGYREYDISKYFLMFFALFVAMIIGDAGYGMIFLSLAIVAHYKSAKSGKPLALAIKLFYVLSVTTVTWGTITGNWFGAVQIASLPFFKALTIPQIVDDLVEKGADLIIVIQAAVGEALLHLGVSDHSSPDALVSVSLQGVVDHQDQLVPGLHPIGMAIESIDPQPVRLVDIHGLAEGILTKGLTAIPASNNAVIQPADFCG